MRLTRLPVALFLTIPLFSCSTLPDLPAPSAEALAAWQAHHQRLQGISHWSAQGRFSLTAGDQNWTGTLDWQQTPEQIRIRLSSPMGQGLISLTETAAGATLRTADQRLIHGDSGEALFRDALGWDLPLGTLGQWLQGRPAPGSDYRYLLSDQGLITTLYQGRWQAGYQAYHDLNPPLPRKLQLLRRGVRFKLVVDHWSIQDNSCTEPSTRHQTDQRHACKPLARTG